ncbi:MAG: IPT/TIG domain-containing protein [Chryseolinea sp.]
MKQNWFNTFFLIAILISCIDEEEIDRDYPTIVTNPVLEIAPSGATFSGKIESSSLNEISEYGFVWGQDDKLLPENSFSLKFGKPLANIITTKIKSSLVAQKIYYARFYIKTDDKTIYGNLVTFKSLGSEGPIITALSAASGVLGDTVVIRGRNFVAQEEKNVVKFGLMEVPILSLTDTAIVVIVPEDLPLDSEHVNVSVSIEGNVANSPEPFTLLLGEIIPIITSVYPHEIKACDTVLIVGKNFKATSDLVELFLPYNYEVNLIKAKDDSIMFSIKLIQYGEFGFTIKTGRFELASPIDFNEGRPTFISSDPLNYKPGGIITLQVKNFPTCLPIVAAAGGYAAEIVSRTENEVKVKLGEYCYYGNYGSEITIAFGVSYGDYFLYSPSIQAKPPQIFSIEPNHGGVNDEVVIHGENFFYIQDYSTDFLNITSHTETEIRGTLRDVYSPTGVIDVSVNSCGQVATLEHGFQYDAPEILDFNPKIITSRDQIITIEGKNFSQGNYTNFISFNNSTSATYGLSQSTNQITFSADVLIPDDLVEAKFSTLITVRTSTGMEVTTTLNLTIDYDGPWKKLKDFPGEPRYNAVGFSIAGKGYAGLGEGITDWYTTHLTDLWEFDPLTEDWTQKASFPGMHSYDVNNTLVANDKAYYMNQNREFWEYDPSLDHWEKKTDYPGLAGSGTEAVTINNKIYMGGGYMDGSTQVYDFWEYNPSQNTWLRLADVPSPIAKPQVFYEKDGKMYSYSVTILGQKFLLTYNPIANVWTSQSFDYSDTRLTEQIFSFADYVFVGRVYCCVFGTEGVLTKIDPTSNTSTTVPYKGPSRHWYTGFTIGNFGYIGLGRRENNQLLKEIWRFDPEKF